ncbi:MAG: extracellular solute-binding protein [Firmicutes bacterium]|nr:extracellular solute-binding protein [Bacillota bacterium]
MAIGKKLLAALLTVFMAVSMLGLSAFADGDNTGSGGTGIENEEQTGNTDTGSTGTVNKADHKEYNEYLAQYAGAARPDVNIVLPYDEHLVLNSDFSISDEKMPTGNFGGIEAVLSSDDKIIAWKVTVPQDGLYNVRVNYYNFTSFKVETGSSVIEYTSKGSSVSRAVYIDGQLPFYDARQVQFSRQWKNETPVQRDEKTNNDLRPFQIEKEAWQVGELRDYLGYYSEPLSFYLTKGEHIIAFSPISESFAISQVVIYQRDEVKSYSQLQEEYEAKGYAPVQDNDDTFIKIQAEDPSDKSDPTLYAIGDRSTPSMEPYHASKIRLNSIGGDKWQNVGSWMEWSFEVKEAGLYKIAFKAKQNVVGGANAHRRMLLDGKEVCSETQDLKFGYSTGYKMYAVGAGNDGSEYMMFYFDKGVHTLRLDVTLGDLSDTLRQAEQSLSQLNVAYRQILMLTGADPDINRDYQFDKVATEALSIFRQENENLKDIEQQVKDAYDGKANEQSSIIRKLILILDDIERRMDTLKERFADLKDNIAALGTWINDMREQPLQMDYIIICAPERELPAGDAGFFDRLWHEISSFIASFTEDYDTIGSVTVEGDEEPVNVWVETGAGNAGNRDNANVLKQIIDSRFTVQYNIAINLKLVASGALLPATLAGNGPDVCLTRGSSDAVNYALRGAVVNLNDESFEGRDEVFAQFHESALTPLRFRTGVYGLPETQDFPMLYYRTDILEELGVDPDTQLNTWDDIYKLLPLLQNKSMNFGMPVPALGVVGGTLNLYATLLYQRGGTIYKMSDEYEYDGITGNLDSDEALDAFKMWTNLFTVNRLPNSYDFANRFRSGEIPVSIAGYSSYNLLSVFAPEIDGLWEFKKVPGTVKEDGTIDYSTAGSVTACIMMSTCKNRENAWRFMAWWTGTEAQALFGREIESLLGSAARYQTANMAAVEQLPWDKKSLEAIKDQWNYVVGIPEVPGSYYMGRNVEFAWKEVINTNSDSNLVLLEYSKIVNDEIARKRDEFKDKLDNKDLW